MVVVNGYLAHLVGRAVAPARELIAFVGTCAYGGLGAVLEPAAARHRAVLLVVNFNRHLEYKRADRLECHQFVLVHTSVGLACMLQYESAILCRVPRLPCRCSCIAPKSQCSGMDAKTVGLKGELTTPRTNINSATSNLHTVLFGLVALYSACAGYI